MSVSPHVRNSGRDKGRCMRRMRRQVATSSYLHPSKVEAPGAGTDAGSRREVRVSPVVGVMTAW